MKNVIQQARGHLLIAWIMALAIIASADAQSNETSVLRLDAQITSNNSHGDRTSTLSSDVIIDRVADNTTGLISVKGNDNTGIYSADYFELIDAADIGQLRFYGFASNELNFLSTLTGFNVIIYNHNGAVPDGDPEGSGTGVLELLNIASADYQLEEGNFTIDVTQANGGEVTLPAGEYWISAYPSVSTPPTGDGRWNWLGSLSAAPDFESVLIDPADLFDENATVWTTISTIVDEDFPSFAWTMTEVGGTFPVHCNFGITTTVEPITNVEFAGIDNSSSAASSSSELEDFTDIEGEVDLEESYIIKLEGNTAGPYENYFTVWIDWNQDGVWDFDTNEMYEIGSITNSTGEDGINITGTITVPENASSGATTMRIIKSYNSSPTDPCAAYGWGQAEDYTIIVINEDEPQEPCDAVTDVEVTNIAETTATVNWIESATATNGYIVDVYESGADPSTDTTIFNETVTTGVTSVDIMGLTPDTDYDVYVISDCGNGETIASDVVIFTSEPTTSVDDFNLTNLTVYPNPAVSDLNISASKVIQDVQVYNILGQRILKVMPGSTDTTIDVSNLSSGAYILKISIEGAVNTMKFIKK